MKDDVLGFCRPKGEPRVFKLNMLRARRLHNKGQASARAGVRKALRATIVHLADQAMDHNDYVALEPLEVLLRALNQLDRGVTPSLLAPAQHRRHSEEMSHPDLRLRLFASAAVSAHRATANVTVKAASAYVAKRLSRLGFHQMRSEAEGSTAAITGTTVLNWYKKRTQFVLRYADRDPNGLSEFDSVMADLHASYRPPPTADQVLFQAARELGSTRDRMG